MELSREYVILTTSDEVQTSPPDDHDHEQATPDERAPSRSWSLVFWGLPAGARTHDAKHPNAVPSPAKTGANALMLALRGA
jgi:hypothetical protein